MTLGKANVYFYVSLGCTIWFLLTGSVWVYFMNLVISLPFGLIGYVMMRKAKTLEGRTKRIKMIEYMLVTGVLISLVVLVALLITN